LSRHVYVWHDAFICICICMYLSWRMYLCDMNHSHAYIYIYIHRCIYNTLQHTATHTNLSWRIYMRDMTHSHAYVYVCKCMSLSWRMYVCDMTRLNADAFVCIYMQHTLQHPATHSHTIWMHAYARVMSHIWMSQVTHINESCHTY